MTIKIFVLLVSLAIGMSGYAQQINHQQKEAGLQDIIRILRKQTTYDIIADKRIYPLFEAKDLYVKEASVSDYIKSCLFGQPLVCVIENNQINIKIADKPVATQNGASQQSLIWGLVVNEKNMPVSDVSIAVAGQQNTTFTNSNGAFLLYNTGAGALLILSGINIHDSQYRVNNTGHHLIRVATKAEELEEVITGYQKIATDRFTGFYNKLDYRNFERRALMFVKDRVEGGGLGLHLFTPYSSNERKFTTNRGTNSIEADQEPAIVVDNVLQTGDLPNIPVSPYDIESITVLKDAAAAPIHGVKAGNGVIIIVTKTGRNNQAASWQFNSTTGVQALPDLNYSPTPGVADYIALEVWLFDKNHYDEAINSNDKLVLSPVVEILLQKRKGLIDAEEANRRIDAISAGNVTDELKKYLYRRPITQQYYGSVRGGGRNYTYYGSGGLDVDRTNLINSQYHRISLNLNGSLNPFRPLTVTGSFRYMQDNRKNHKLPFTTIYPYARLKDNNGNSLAVNQDIRQSYKDSVAQNLPFDWKFRPVEEMAGMNGRLTRTDIRADMTLIYDITKGLQVKVLYQFNEGRSERRNLYTDSSYYLRNLKNKFNFGANEPVPPGGLLFYTDIHSQAHNVRIQADLDRRWGRFRFTAMGGAEARTNHASYTAGQFFGWSVRSPFGRPVDHTQIYPVFYNPDVQQYLPDSSGFEKMDDRVASYFASALLTYQNKYSFNLIARNDRANTFGREFNKDVPLFSFGLVYNISGEKFYPVGMPLLGIKGTHGYSGNMVSAFSAFSTTGIDNKRIFRMPYATRDNPDNPALKFEKTRLTDIVMDVSTRNNRLNVSIAWYSKYSDDLLVKTTAEPTTGTGILVGNLGTMRTKGFELQINSVNIKAGLIWQSRILVSQSSGKIIKYPGGKISVWQHIISPYPVPLEGEPLFSVSAMRWAGLDPGNGEPRGYLNGEPSNEYETMLAALNRDGMVTVGSAHPVWTAFLLNEFSWRDIDFSFSLTGKFKYFFRRESLNYTEMFDNPGAGHKELAFRWQKSGDERSTDVPSMIYPAQPYRDLFYKLSEVNVERGDHIRIQDLRLSYTLHPGNWKRIPFGQVQVFAFVNNAGIAWRANKKGLDPDAQSGFPEPRSISFGIIIHGNKR